MEEIQEKIYTESEILDILAGLSVVYYQTPWPIRFLLKPWRDALQAAAVTFSRSYYRPDESVPDSIKEWLKVSVEDITHP